MKQIVLNTGSLIVFNCLNDVIRLQIVCENECRVFIDCI